MEINVAAVFGVRLLDSFGLPCVGLWGDGWRGFSFALPCVSFVNVCQYVFVLLLVFKAGCGI